MSDQHIKVSVIIPVYNAERYLRECLDSVVQQTLRETEIICVDDGSTDSSAAILREYAAKDDRIILLRQENGGAGKARNSGLDIARGETLSFLDADDFFEPTMLEKAYSRLREQQADFIAFGSDVYAMGEGKFVANNPVRWDTIPLYEPFTFRAISGNVFRAFIGWAWDKLYDARFIRENGLRFQEQRTTNDMYFTFAAIVLAKRIVTLKDLLAHHRKEERSSLSNTREKSWHCYHDALMKLKGSLEDWGLGYEMEQDFVNYCLHATIWNLDSLTGEARKALYEKLQREWLEEFGLRGREERYFDSKSDYQKLLRMQSLPYEEYARE